mmetsp:Transcript_51153/g.135133  ORF Transcript_51153/g.135133 Transcript_51153/m.135133 type:complete len:484 (+) Transcript_51153:46-1497(+)
MTQASASRAIRQRLALGKLHVRLVVIAIPELDVVAVVELARTDVQALVGVGSPTDQPHPARRHGELHVLVAWDAFPQVEVVAVGGLAPGDREALLRVPRPLDLPCGAGLGQVEVLVGLVRVAVPQLHVVAVVALPSRNIQAFLGVRRRSIHPTDGDGEGARRRARAWRRRRLQRGAWALLGASVPSGVGGQPVALDRARVAGNLAEDAAAAGRAGRAAGRVRVAGDARAGLAPARTGSVDIAGAVAEVEHVAPLVAGVGGAEAGLHLAAIRPQLVRARGLLVGRHDERHWGARRRLQGHPDVEASIVADVPGVPELPVARPPPRDLEARGDRGRDVEGVAPCRALQQPHRGAAPNRQALEAGRHLPATPRARAEVARVGEHVDRLAAVVHDLDRAPRVRRGADVAALRNLSARDTSRPVGGRLDCRRPPLVRLEKHAALGSACGRQAGRQGRQAATPQRSCHGRGMLCKGGTGRWGAGEGGRP